jgi:acylphosphatase
VSRIARHLIISGRVQGVGYRDWLRFEAESRGLSGWVRNRHDGTVEALVCGERAAVAAMVVACHEGPLLARVTVIAESDAVEPEETGFRRLPTL